MRKRLLVIVVLLASCATWLAVSSGPAVATAVSRVGSATSTTPAGGGSEVSITAPAAQPGDLQIGQISVGGSDGNVQICMPAGWAVMGQRTQAAGNGLLKTLWLKRTVTAIEPPTAHTFRFRTACPDTGPVTVRASGGIVAYRDAEINPNLSGATSSGTGSALIPPTFSTIPAGSWVVGMCALGTVGPITFSEISPPATETQSLVYSQSVPAGDPLASPTIGYSDGVQQSDGDSGFVECSNGVNGGSDAASATFLVLRVPVDSDADGVYDTIDNCPDVANADQADSDTNGIGDACQDTDGDGLIDSADNCPAVANADQADSDSNGIGDACQDTDNDTVLDTTDNCPTVANADQADSDSNGIGDACQDTDNDTVLDTVDNCPSVANADQADSDTDGIGNACEDADSDGVYDPVDNCPNVANADQADSNHDGTGDACQSVVIPDGLVAIGDGAFVGNDVYNTDGSNQTVSLSFPRKKTREFRLRVQNDGTTTETFTLTGCAIDPPHDGYTTKYLDGSDDVTDEVNSGAYLIEDLAPGATQDVTLEIKLLKYGLKRPRTCLLTFGADSGEKDVVGVKVSQKGR